MRRLGKFWISVLATTSWMAATAYERTDKPEGWASQSGGTTGGQGGTEVTVSTMAELQAEAKSSGKKIIIVNKGTYTGSLSITSDKSILGKEPGVLLKGNISISKVSNIILRNIALQGNRCNTYDECKGGSDGINVNNESHHIWLDHLDVSDGQDGNCDVTNGSDFVTITWCKFSYTYDKEHRFSNLIAADDNVAVDKGKLNITYAYNWWADRVVERQPRGRAGKVHVVNNYYTSTATNYVCGPGVDIQMLIENNNMKTSGTAIKPFEGSPAPAWKSVGNIGTAKDIGLSSGTVFTPPYSLTLKMAASDVEAKVKPAAGNTLTLGSGATSLLHRPGTSLRSEASVSPSPFVSSTPTGFRVFNPGTAALKYEVVSVNGQKVISRGMLPAGESHALPNSAHGLLVRFLE
jgi:pectate lyase